MFLVDPFRFGGGSSPIQPNTLTNLWTWHKRGTGMYSDAGTTLQTTNGGTIQQWNDQSGNGKHLSQGTSAARPTLDTGTQYLGNNTIRFDPSTAAQWFGWAFFALPGSTAIDMWHIVKASSDTPAANCTLMYAAKEGSGGSGMGHYPTTTGHIKDGTATNGQTDFGAAPVSLSSQFRVYNYVLDTSGLNVYLDNVSIYSDASGRSVSFNKIAAAIGSRAVDGGAEHFDGWLAESFIFTSLRTPTERAGLYSYATT